MNWTMSDKYRDFFLSSSSERLSILQGGRRSGKTTNTFLWMWALSQLTLGVKYAILCYQYPQLAKTMSDFELVRGVHMSSPRS